MRRKTMRCSFCGRNNSEVEKLVAGPFRIFAGRVYICDRCAAQTIQIMERHSDDSQPPRETHSLLRRALNALGGWRHHDAPGRSECHAI